ncbi:hypothetical protein [Chryseobacterium populi]|uniref:Uncharacterized protein n=1 Tax=Chryseobacterium populi TaxID=1144316 RepID=J2K3T1_9FLAO|nr:hypothetical protein [Chryseobacterium populi]EJL74835.1 hypothetical protein PMI13_00714 [Chryseobacterium populi]
MAEELYFIKPNPSVAKINLYNKLCREEQSVLDFLEDDKKASLEIIKQKVKDSVENLTKEELLNIFSWFSNNYHSDSEEVKTQLFINGIDLFYEIPATSDVQSFQQILSDYEKYSQRHLNYKVDAEEFNRFLIYGIFYSAMLQKDDQNIVADFLKTEHKMLFSFAEEQFKANNEGLILENASQKNIYNYFSDLYDSTKFYKGSIIKLHDA